jgi:hypothetical protein
MAKSKKLPVAVERDVMKVLNRRIDKIDAHAYKELEEMEIDYIPEAKTVWELLKYSARIKSNMYCDRCYKERLDRLSFFIIG